MPKVVPEYKEEAKKKILSAGCEVMSRKGYRSTTMDDIAEHIGVSKAALYQYFGSKDELVIEIVKAFPAQIRERTIAMYPAATPLDAWATVMDFYLENTDEQNALFYELLSLIPGNPDIAMSFSANVRFIMDKTAAGIEKHQDKGPFADCESRTAAVAIMSLLHGLRALSLMGIGRDELRERGMEIGKIFLGTSRVPAKEGKMSRGKTMARSSQRT